MNDNTPLLTDFDADARTCAPDFPWWSLANAADTAALLEAQRDHQEEQEETDRERS